MAEPSEYYAKKLVEVFLHAYNAENSTNFKWIDGKSYQPKDKFYFDFVVFDNDKELGIQHSRAVSDPVREFIKPKAAENVIEPVRNMLEENLNIPSLLIYINFHNPPTKKDETDRIIYWLEYFITSKVTSNLGVGYFNYEANFDDQFLPRLLTHIDYIDIRPYPRKMKNRIISIAYGWSGKAPEPWLDDAQRILNAINNKVMTGKDTLLLIESGWSGIHEIYRKKIVDELKDKEFKEIWIAELFVNDEKAFRVK